MNEDIILMLAGRDEIKKHINSIPHRDLLDLSACYFRSFGIGKDDKTGFGLSILLEEELDKTGISDPDKLYENALKNTQSLMPASIERINEQMICISNRMHMFGATAIMYDGVLAGVSEMMGSDLFLIPSSIHEIICVSPDLADPGDIYEYIQYINQKYVTPEEVLSGSLYYYEAAERCLSIAYSDDQKAFAKSVEI